PHSPPPTDISTLSLHDALPIFDRDAALDRQDMALERGADAERNHRHAMAAADVDDIAHLFRALGEDHDVGKRVGEVGLVLAVVLDRKSTRLNSSHLGISYAVFC